MTVLLTLWPWMPSRPLPEMTLRAPVAVPPIVLLEAPVRKTPEVPLAIGALPAKSRPMVFPRRMLPVVPAPLSSMPFDRLPERTLPSPALVPPIVLRLAALLSQIPSKPLPIGPVPAAFVPMKLPWMRLFAELLTSMPSWVFPEMTLPLMVFRLAPPMSRMPLRLLPTSRAPVRSVPM